MSYKLPKMEHSFHVEIKGKETGLMWVGDFKYRRPNIRQRGQIDVRTAEMNGDLATIDPDIGFLHSALAHLEYTIFESPDWFTDSQKGKELYDTNVVLEIYTLCIKFEAEWREKVLGGDKKKVEEKDGSDGEVVREDKE